MKYRTFTLRYDAAEGRYDDAELVQFLESHDALTVYEHMVPVAGEPVWAILVGYRAPRPARPLQAPLAPSPPSEDPVEVDEADRPLFQALRQWRKERARQLARPAYVILHDRQLAAIARARPATLTALRELPGVGEARSRDYGDEVLAIVARHAERADG
ncbi:MAG TPA: HRDC domain-containing protein [Myxococcota bacterium]|nr:HRDC domain-containing protein [Myxococcota bacterium]